MAMLQPGITERHGDALDRLALLGMLLFALAIMDGVTAMLLDRPWFVLGCALAVYALNVTPAGLGRCSHTTDARPP
jgi:hypothetical protein